MEIARKSECSTFPVSLVLSSGEGLGTLHVSSAFTVAQLKGFLRKSLSQQIRTYQNSRSEPPAALLLRSSPQECLNVTYTTVATSEMRLFAYCGEELRDNEMAIWVNSPICVLRPADIVTISCNLQGALLPTVFNPLSMTVWEESQRLGCANSLAMELICLSSAKGVLLCSAQTTETPQTLKTRLNSMLKTEEMDLKLWFRGEALEQSSLQACGLGHRSRLSVQVGEEMLALAQDCKGNRTVFPIPAQEKADYVHKTACLLDIVCTSVHEYTCISPVSPQFARFFLLIQPDSRLISLNFLTNPSTSILIPSVCCIGHVKSCIAAQHGLSAASLSLSTKEELQWTKTFEDYGVKNGDLVVIVRKKMQSGSFIVSLLAENGTKYLFSMFSNHKIAFLKLKMQAIMPELGANIEIMRFSRVLDSNSSFAECGITDNVQLFCCTLEEMKRKRLELASKLDNFPCISSDLALNSDTIDEKPTENSISRLSIWLITATSAIPLRIPSTWTVSDLKAALNLPQASSSYRLIHAEKPLEDFQSLSAQGIRSGSALALLPASALWVVALTAGGGRCPLVVCAQGKVATVGTVLEQWTGLQASSHRLWLDKEFAEDGEGLPAAVHRLKARLAGETTDKTSFLQ